MTSPDLLHFRDFDEGGALRPADPEASTLSASSSDSLNAAAAAGQDIQLELSGDEEEQEESSELLGRQNQAASSGFWTFEYYQSFFNVDSLQVLDRVRGSVIPLPGRNFVKHHLRNNPDLYGPFWICVTLVFSVAISGNLSSFLSQMGSSTFHYRPQFHRVTMAAVVIFLYAWLVPVALWGFLTWRQTANQLEGGYSFLETLCVYGYSLSIYIPTSVLWIIPLEWVQWTLILVAMVMSGSVLVFTFWPVVRQDTRVMAGGVLVTMVVLHTLLAVVCKLFFFQTAVQNSASEPTATPHTPVDTTAH